jgi:hypothetical protein
VVEITVSYKNLKRLETLSVEENVLKNVFERNAILMYLPISQNLLPFFQENIIVMKMVLPIKSSTNSMMVAIQTLKV